MGMLDGKRLLIAGLVSNRSIAYGIARAMKREGARLAFTYQSEQVKDRVMKLTREFEPDAVVPCDVASDEEIAAAMSAIGRVWSVVDGLVHSIAFAPREALSGNLLDGIDRDSFRVAHEISSYSFVAMVKQALSLMNGRPAAALTLSYVGSAVAIPNYNVMGLAKASLEAGARYLADAVGPKGVRVNVISAGPIKTIAAAAISGFGDLLDAVEQRTPLRRNVTLDEIGNAAAFLCSDLASGITGEVLYVDCGFHSLLESSQG